jgi:hypothetical protein
MKRSIGILVCTLPVGTIYAQGISQSNVPAVVLNSFFSIYASRKAGEKWYASLILEESEISQYSYPSVIQMPAPLCRMRERQTTTNKNRYHEKNNLNRTGFNYNDLQFMDPTTCFP